MSNELISKFLEIHEVQRMLWDIDLNIRMLWDIDLNIRMLWDIDLNISSKLHSVERILLPIYTTI